MKKLLLKFADSVLTREELKTVRGASGCGKCYTQHGATTCIANPYVSGSCICVSGPDKSCR
jgi:hypothetical protein